MRYALRVDANQTQVISALEAAGAKVMVIGKPVDLLVGINHRFALIEVKDGKKYASQQKKTPLQDRFFEMFEGYPVFLVDGPESAIVALEIVKNIDIYRD